MRIVILSLLLVFLLGLAPATLAEDDFSIYRDVLSDPSTHISTYGLEDITSVRLVIVDLDSDFSEVTGVTKESIKNQVEVYLRQIKGLEVVEEGAYVPWFNVKVDGRRLQYKEGPSLFVSGSISIELCEPALIKRPSRTLMIPSAITWRDSFNFFYSISDVNNASRGVLSQLLESFHNEYLKANPMKYLY